MHKSPGGVSFPVWRSRRVGHIYAELQHKRVRLRRSHREPRKEGGPWSPRLAMFAVISGPSPFRIGMHSPAIVIVLPSPFSDIRWRLDVLGGSVS